MKKSELFIAIPVHNRFKMIEVLLNNWKEAGFFNGEYKINISDDNSSEFSFEDLQNLLKKYGVFDVFCRGGDF